MVGERIPLTIMNDVDGIARSQNGENSGIIKASGVFGAVLGLRAGTENISLQACQVRDVWFTLAPLKDG